MTAVERCRVVVLVMVDLTTAVNTTDQTILLNRLLGRFCVTDRCVRTVQVVPLRTAATRACWQ